jgi:hypothetical protein
MNKELKREKLRKIMMEKIENFAIFLQKLI